MRIHRAHDGRTIEVKQALAQFAGLDDLLDAMSLATGISTDNIICMTEKGLQLTEELLTELTEGAQDGEAEPADQHMPFFVFNREYLYADVEVVAQELAEEPLLSPEPAPSSLALIQPPTPRSLEAIVASSHALTEYIHTHASTSRAHHAALAIIQRSTAIALANLLSHSANVRDVEADAKTSCRVELLRMKTLLDGYQRDLEILGLVTVNPRLLPSSSSSSSSAAHRRTLGDFVSRAKMGHVADGCHNVYLALQARFDEIQLNAEHLTADTNDLSAEVDGTTIQPSTDTLEEINTAESGAQGLATFLVESCSPDPNGWPVADRLDAHVVTRIHAALTELYRLDALTRDNLRRLTADKNDMSARSLALLGDISSLQSDYAELSATLTTFRTDLTSPEVDQFRHLARLNNMLWAYGATVVEIVRRREFFRFHYAKSEALAELMAKLSSRERKRRMRFRTKVAGQLPWDVRGMDEAPPTLEMSTTKGAAADADTAPPPLDRRDLDELLELYAEIERTVAQADAISGDSTAHFITPIRETIKKMASRIDDMEEDFVDLVEDYLLPRSGGGDSGGESDDDGDGELASSAAQSSDGGGVSAGTQKRRQLRKQRKRQAGANQDVGDDAAAAAAAATATAAHLQQELQNVIQENERRERSDHEAHQHELNSLRNDAHTARGEARKLKDDVDSARRDAATARSELDALRTDVATERERRINMQEELTLLRAEAQAARKAEADAHREAAEESERLAEADSHLHDLQAELEEAKSARIDASNRIERLLSEGSNVERELFAAQERIQDLHTQLENARHETRDARDALADAEATRDRTIRSHRAEADSDRAILEEQLREVRVDLDAARAECARVRDSGRLDAEAVETLRGQLRGADEAHEELVKAMEGARDASAEAELARRHAEREAEMLLELARPLLERMVAIKRHVEGLPTLSSSRGGGGGGGGAADTAGGAGADSINAVAPASASVDDGGYDDDEGGGARAALSAFLASPTSASTSVTLAALRALSPAQTADDTTRKLDVLVTLVRKWQKTYKRQTSETAAKMTMAARDRIAFRNFAIGDLALFLPSRNNSLDPKPWAAFNISFPHYFLNAPTGSVLAEQLRAKEWIVARIMRVVEKTASGDADGADSDGNPFQLAPGTRYCLLDVDGWNPNSPVVTRPPRGKARGMSEPGKPRSGGGGGGGGGDGGEGTADDGQGQRNGHAPAGAGADDGAARPTAPKRSLTSGPFGDTRASGGDDLRDGEGGGGGGRGEGESSTDAADAAPSPSPPSPSTGANGNILPTSVTSPTTSPSALTKAMRASASSSQPPSTSRGFATPSRDAEAGGTDLNPDMSASITSTATHATTSTMPAFGGGVRGRRRIVRNGQAGGLAASASASASVNASAATSPGDGNAGGGGGGGGVGLGALLAAPSVAAAGALTAPSSMGRARATSSSAVNPFSQSPAVGAAGTSAGTGLASRMAAAKAAARGKASDATSPLTATSPPTATSPTPTPTPTPTAATTAAATPRRALLPTRSPSITSRASLVLSASPTAHAVPTAVPLAAEASMTIARGEVVAGSFGSSSGGGGGSVEDRRQRRDSSGFSRTSDAAGAVSTSGHNASALTTKKRTSLSTAGTPPALGFLSLSRTFGRRANGSGSGEAGGFARRVGSSGEAGGSRRPASTLFGADDVAVAASSPPPPPSSTTTSIPPSASASDILKKFGGAK